MQSTFNKNKAKNFKCRKDFFHSGHFKKMWVFLRRNIYFFLSEKKRDTGIKWGSKQIAWAILQFFAREGGKNAIFCECLRGGEGAWWRFVRWCNHQGKKIAREARRDKKNGSKPTSRGKKWVITHVHYFAAVQKKLLFGKSGETEEI